jgi:hypothetical protein
MPDSVPAAIVTLNTTSGFSRRVAPNTIGCTTCWSGPLAAKMISPITIAEVEERSDRRRARNGK